MLPALHVGPTLAAWMAVTMTYAFVVTGFVEYCRPPKWLAGHEIAAILGVVLGMLIVFRNNAANDRWWEARKLWGQLINDLRNLALKARAYAAVDALERHRFGLMLVAFAHALRLHLRDVKDLRSVPGFAHDPATFPHIPGYVAEVVHQTLNRWNRAGQLQDTIWILDRHASALMDICGACERIKNTPLASSYRSLCRTVIGLYVLFAPWAVAMEVGWWGMPILAIGFGFLIGIELTAEAVEEPFGQDGDDLPLEKYCQTIEIFVTAALEAPVTETGPEDEATGSAA